MTATVEVMPSWSGAAHARSIAATAMRLTYKVQAHGAHHVGTSGPAVLVTRCEGLLAGTVLHATVPRPVHVLANAAMMAALRQGLMTRAGIIPVDAPTAIGAQHAARAAIADERAVALTGSTVDPAYLLATTGAPLIPVVMLGVSGRVPTDPPRPRSRIDVYYFDPVEVQVSGDPLGASVRAGVAEQVRQALTDAERIASVRAGRSE